MKKGNSDETDREERNKKGLIARCIGGVLVILMVALSHKRDEE